MNKETSKIPDYSIRQLTFFLEQIKQKEPDAFIAIGMALDHVAGTYVDKYEDGEELIRTKTMLYSKQGAILNTYQVCRYLQRYNTKGQAKSLLLKDVIKSIHYLLFEVTRRIKEGDVSTFEPKV